MSKIFVKSVSKNESREELIAKIKEVFLNSTNNLSFLKEGDLVLLKPALNSPDSYPATTHPLALKVVAEILLERGARVVAGDQSGVEHVVLSSSRKYGSSKDNYLKSKMSDSGVDFVAFEDEGYENGYYYFNNSKVKSWKNGFYVSNWIKKADHIINLPRISTHAMSGVTLGFKNAVGVLRDDSRKEFHTDGPFNKMIVRHVEKYGFGKYKNENKFIEKIVEINLAMQDKLRATLFVATKAQTTMGPNKKVLPLLHSTVVEPEEGLVFSSSDLVSADVFALSFLTFLYRKKTPLLLKIFEKIVLIASSKFHNLDKESPWQNKFIKHGLGIGLGDSALEIDWGNISDGLKKELNLLLVKN